MGHGKDQKVIRISCELYDKNRMCIRDLRMIQWLNFARQDKLS